MAKSPLSPSPRTTCAVPADRLSHVARRHFGSHRSARLAAYTVLLTLGALVASLLTPGPATAAPAPSPFASNAARAWGIDAFSATADTVATLQTKMHRQFASDAVYSQLGDGATYPNADAVTAMSAHALIYLNINTARGTTRNRQPDCWIDIVHGQYDSNIDQWASRIKATNYSKLVITLQHEQSITSATQPRCSSDTPALYRQAFDHFYKRMRAHGVTARFAWVPTAASFITGLADSYAPPAADFSVVGADVYADSNNNGWRTAASLLTPFFDWQARVAPSKSLLIGEIGATETDSRAPGWYADAIALLKQHPNLLAVNWNGSNDRPTHRMYSPLLNDQTLAVWLAGARNTFFS